MVQTSVQPLYVVLWGVPDTPETPAPEQFPNSKFIPIAGEETAISQHDQGELGKVKLNSLKQS